MKVRSSNNAPVGEDAHLDEVVASDDTATTSVATPERKKAQGTGVAGVSSLLSRVQELHKRIATCTSSGSLMAS